MANRKGRVTIPTDLDVVPQTKEIMERWGAAVGKITFTEDQVKAGDVDGSGSIAVSDALLILQRAVDKIPNFPVEKA